MFDSIRIVDAAVLVAVVFTLVKLSGAKSRSPPPPGPRRLPLIGNLLDVPSMTPWVTFVEWGKRWGGLVSLSIMGESLIIVNSYETAIDLLEKRSSLYSDRVQLPSSVLIGFTNVVPSATYGSDTFREQRRMITQVVGTRALVERLWPTQKDAINKFLPRLARDPERFIDHLRTLAGSFLLALTYGYQVKNEKQDHMVWLAQRTTEDFAQASLPGQFLVDVVPALRHIPSWFPGGGWWELAGTFKRNFEEFYNTPFAYLEDQMAKGTAVDCFAKRNLENRPTSASPNYVKNIKFASVALFGAGSDTTVGTLTSFFLAMVLYPEVQRKARAEIDSVVGSERLPDYQDRDNLPYIDALCKELLRWMPVAPIGIPHRLMKDDVYQGYFLPEGAQILVNQWGMLRDPERYHNPEEFRPERHIRSPTSEPEMDPHIIAFGFGRRVCPGMHAADAMIFATVAAVLSVFEIGKAIENGIPITPPMAQKNGGVSHPQPFKCSIKVRSREAEALIHSAAEAGA